MSTQPSLPGFPPAPSRPRRRCRWAEEMRRALALIDDARARDRRRHAAELAALAGQMAELRNRMSDVERAGGLADIDRAPRRGELRRFAGRVS